MTINKSEKLYVKYQAALRELNSYYETAKVRLAAKHDYLTLAHRNSVDKIRTKFSAVITLHELSKPATPTTPTTTTEVK
jgi:hypothetical protein